MIKVRIDFENMESREYTHEFDFDFPADLVFRAAKSDNTHHINARYFSASDEMMAYLSEQRPDLKEMINNSCGTFMGRHNLGQKYGSIANENPIPVDLGFFDKNNGRYTCQADFSFPEKMILKETSIADIALLKSQSFLLTENMKDYIADFKPDLRKYFNKCIGKFIGVNRQWERERIKIEISFYNRETERGEKDTFVYVPKQMVFDVAGTEDIGKIACFGYDLSPEMLDYIKREYPATISDFDEFLYDFSGEDNVFTMILPEDA